MVRTNNLNEFKNADSGNQILRLMLTQSSETDFKDEIFNTEGQVSEEEASTSVGEQRGAVIPVDDRCVKTEHEIDLSDDNVEDLSSNPDYLYCDDPTSVAIKEENDDPSLEGIRCVICNEDITDYRYTCVQCSGYDLCVACEASGAHDQHYVLRAPRFRPDDEIKIVVKKIRNYLMTEIDLLSAMGRVRPLEKYSSLCANNQQEQADSTPENILESISESIAEDGAKRKPKERHEAKKTISKSETKSKQPHIKKPLNAFMLFLKEMRDKVTNECTIKQMATFNQLIGRRWHSLSKEDKQMYFMKANQERLGHQLLYPEWKSTCAKSKKRRPRVNLEVSDRMNKKCRARYGLKYRDKWCERCKVKKKCQRYMKGAQAERVLTVVSPELNFIEDMKSADMLESILCDSCSTDD